MLARAAIRPQMGALLNCGRFQLGPYVFKVAVTAERRF